MKMSKVRGTPDSSRDFFSVLVPLSAEVVLHAEQEIQRLCYLLLKLYGILLRRLKANAVEFCSINSLVRG